MAMRDVSFGIFDHLDKQARPLGDTYADRLELLSIADRAGFYSYHLAEHATHLHVVCRGCGWVGEAPLSTADELVARLDESLGFASDVSHAAVHGLCRTCREVSS